MKKKKSTIARPTATYAKRAGFGSDKRFFYLHGIFRGHLLFLKRAAKKLEKREIRYEGRVPDATDTRTGDTRQTGRYGRRSARPSRPVFPAGKDPRNFRTGKTVPYAGGQTDRRQADRAG